MSYGVLFKNNADTVILDSEFARLVVLEKGTWAASGGATVTFAKPVTTPEPPLVFVKPTSAGSGMLCFCLVLGTSGNWTGFTFTGVVGQASYGSWFSAAFKSTPTARYGFRIWDGSGKLLFDSGTPCAQFTKTLTSWTYLGATQTSQGVYRLSWTAPYAINGGDYMLLNNIAMDLAGSTSRQGNLYAIWDFPNNRLLIQAVGVDLQSTLLMPVVFAKPNQ